LGLHLPHLPNPGVLDEPVPSMSLPSTGLRKPAARGLQPLTLPRVVATGGKLSPRAGVVSFPPSPISASTTRGADLASLVVLARVPLSRRPVLV